MTFIIILLVIALLIWYYTERSIYNKNVWIIKQCLDTYTKTISELPKEHDDYSFNDMLNSLHEEHLAYGVCDYIQNILKIYKYHPRWIKRHIIEEIGHEYRMFWGICPEDSINMQEIIESLELRRNILEKEYNHHLKWGILAKYIKP